MSPGVNDGSRKTGTLPKSNRRNDRNRDIHGANQQSSLRSIYNGRLPQHPNNLLDWQPVSDREFVRGTKNSNTRPTSSSVPSTSYQDLADIATRGGNRQYFSSEDYAQYEMSQPVNSRTQSPPSVSNAKPTNVDKMPDRRQVESRLNQIRDYIRVTTTMMESLSQSSDPRARTQHDKLSKMVEDLGDSESKLSKLLEDYRGLPEENGEKENGGESVESVLRKKMEASQRKLAQLQEHQANLVGMQLQVRERLNEARQAQQVLLLQENQASSTVWENNSNSSSQNNQLTNDAESLESETAILRNKLSQLQNKKKQMDNLVAELQAAEISDRASCSSDNSKHAERDKVAELDVLKAQLAHLKGLMEEATRVRENCNAPFENPDSSGIGINGNNNNGKDDEEEDDQDDDNDDEEEVEENGAVNHVPYNGLGEQRGKFNNTKEEQLTVEQIQAVTREMKEQQVLLQSARAELQRLKNSALANNSTTGSISPSSFLGTLNRGPERKIGNNNNNNNNNNHNNNNNNNYNEAQQQQLNKNRQLEQLVRKDHSVNRDNSAGWDSRRASNSRLSHVSTPNMWPTTGAAAGSSNEQSVDGNLAPDTFLDLGGQASEVDNNVNWWNISNPPVNQLPQGSVGPAEYYRQMLMNSQAQQLQLMSTTMQQCCQLLWAQQKELQAMRSSITQLQQQVRQANSNQTRIGVINEATEGYSNLNQSTRHLDNNLDTTLPPSSSLPNLVTLPNPSSVHSHNSGATSTNQQHHQQLNNQVPPGNRANNYWDNFRSYSRQNLLSGNGKTETVPGPPVNASGAIINTTYDKRNREHAAENLSLASLTSSDVQYSLNFQLQSNLQSQDREVSTARSNILSNENATSQQQVVDNYWEEAHSFRLAPENNEDLYCLRHLSDEMRDVLQSLVAANRRRPDYLVIILREIKSICDDHRLRPRLLRSLRALQDAQSSRNHLNEANDQTASESCQSSDDDSDVGAQAGSLLNSNQDNQSLLSEFLMPLHPAIQGPGSAAVSDFEFEGAMQLDNIVSINPIAPSLATGYNEDLAEADQSRPEVSNDQQISLNEASDDGLESGDAGAQNQASLEVNPGLFEIQNQNNPVVENSTLDRIPTRLFHH